MYLVLCLKELDNLFHMIAVKALQKKEATISLKSSLYLILANYYDHLTYGRIHSQHSVLSNQCRKTLFRLA